MRAQDLSIYRKAVRTKDRRLSARASARELSHVRTPPHLWTPPHFWTPPHLQTPPYSDRSILGGGPTPLIGGVVTLGLSCNRSVVVSKG